MKRNQFDLGLGFLVMAWITAALATHAQITKVATPNEIVEPTSLYPIPFLIALTFLTTFTLLRRSVRAIEICLGLVLGNFALHLCVLLLHVGVFHKGNVLLDSEIATVTTVCILFSIIPAWLLARIMDLPTSMDEVHEQNEDSE